MHDVQILSDLAERWRCARRAALKAVVPLDGTDPPDGTEDSWLRRALAQDVEATHRQVFENSLRLGLGFARYYDHELALDDLPTAVATLASPCASGTWSRDEDEPALRLSRSGCAMAALGPAACDYWREALDGLLLGITGGIRHARHRSVGHGDGDCLDVAYVDPESELRYGPIPEEMTAGLAEVERLARTFAGGTRLEFLGISEGVLHYEQTNGHPGQVSVTSLVERALRRRFPTLKLREVSPRSVLADADSDSDGSHEGMSVP